MLEKETIKFVGNDSTRTLCHHIKNPNKTHTHMYTYTKNDVYFLVFQIFLSKHVDKCDVI